MLFRSNSNDIFLVKLNAAGNFIAAHHAGGSAVDLVNAMSTDDSGNCYITGTFNSPEVVFGNDTLVYTSSGLEAYIARFDSAGNSIWGRAGTGPGNQEPSGIAVGINGNCYIAGVFKGDTMYLDTTTLITYGYYDFFTSVHD